MADSFARLWDKYISKTISYKVSEDSMLWYVRHVETFITARKNARLVVVFATNIEAHLEVIGRKRYMVGCKFMRVGFALRIASFFAAR